MMFSDKTDLTRPSRSGLSFLEVKEPLTLALVLLIVSGTSGLIAYRINKYVFLFFGDAASHIVKARELIDYRHVGIENIGTVWLPLLHFLMVPFVWVDDLFFSGIAGAVVGVPCLVGTGVLLFSIIRRITGSAPIAFVSACVFGLNPNVTYMALTPMSEPLLFFLVTLGGYALLRWLDEAETRWLTVCAIVVMLATLCRYEAWFLALFVSIIAAAKGTSLWRHQGKRMAAGMLAIAGLSLAGIFLWFWWNWYEYGDVLAFVPWKYHGASGGVHDYLGYRQEAAAVTMMRAIVNIFGPVVLLASAVGVVRLLRLSAERRRWLLYVFLSVPSLFIIVGILTNNVLIDQWWWNWRFVLIFGLFLSVTGGIGLAEVLARIRPRLARGVVTLGFLAMPVVQVMVPSVGVATYEDASKIFGGLSKDAAAFGEQLRAIYKGGSVVLLTGSGLGERIMVSSWVPLKNFHLLLYPGGQDILGPIRYGDRYVVIGKVRLPDSREVVDYWLSRRELFLRYYNILLEDGNYLLLERKSSDALKSVK